MATTLATDVISRHPTAIFTDGGFFQEYNPDTVGTSAEYSLNDYHYITSVMTRLVVVHRLKASINKHPIIQGRRCTNCSKSAQTTQTTTECIHESLGIVAEKLFKYLNSKVHLMDSDQHVTGLLLDYVQRQEYSFAQSSSICNQRQLDSKESKAESFGPAFSKHCLNAFYDVLKCIYEANI